jgi:predicted Zn-dependent peptidase
MPGSSFSLSNSPIVRDVLDNGLRILTEQMTQVRSISIGVWLTRGSRHEAAEQSGIAHFVEHMLFKGTATRSAEDIAQAIDSIGGQLDAFTAKEYASYYIKVLDEHLPLALDILSDIVLNPAFSPEDLEREKKVVVEENRLGIMIDVSHPSKGSMLAAVKLSAAPIIASHSSMRALAEGLMKSPGAFS